MSYTPSTSPDITESLPAFLSSRSVSQALSRTGTKFDIAIAGIGFVLAPTPQNPYVRQSAPVQKQQFDTSTEAGEQTLDQYWTRSQTSWHRGAGVEFYEPGYSSNGARFWEQGAQVLTEYRYTDSVGVNVWKRDQATLLYRMSQLTTSGGAAYVASAKLNDSSDVVFANVNGTIKRYNTAGTATTYTGLSHPATTRVTVCGSKVVTGHAYGLDIAPVDGGTTFTSLYTQAAGADVVPYWAKGRIIAAIGNSLYELPLTPSTPPVAITSSQLLMTHPDPNWVWTGVTECANAIIASGRSAGRGEIFKFTLESGSGSSATLPVLSQGYQIAEMPPGEEVHAIKGYLGTWLGIGTSRGIRVAMFDQNANLQYGPLIVETISPVRALAARDSFIYGTVENQIGPNYSSGAVCINLGEPEPHEDLRFAYAWDAMTHTTTQPQSICFYGTSGKMAIGINGDGIYAQSTTQYEPSGYILSGRIRYRTVEKKLFRLVDMKGQIADGSMNLSVVDENGSEVSVVTLNKDTGDAGHDITLSQPTGFHEYLQFRTTLSASTDGLVSPVLQSLRIKAVPAPKRQRLIQLPLQCADKEKDSMGVPFGREGFGLSRLQALEAAEQNSVIMQVQDFTTGEAYDCYIEEIQFMRISPRAADGRPNFGGMVKLTVRVL